MKALIWINKIVGAVLAPLLFLYIFTGYEKTPKEGWLYYPELLGWTSDTSIIYLTQEGWFVGVMTVLGGAFLIRYIVYIITSITNDNETFSYHASHNLSNILDLIYAYIFINILMSGFYLESSGWIVFLCILLGITFIIWKGGEMVNAMDDSSHWGLFNFRKDVFKYYMSAADYKSYTQKLTNNYKKLIE